MTQLVALEFVRTCKSSNVWSSQQMSLLLSSDNFPSLFPAWPVWQFSRHWHARTARWRVGREVTLLGCRGSDITRGGMWHSGAIVIFWQGRKLLKRSLKKNKVSEQVKTSIKVHRVNYVFILLCKDSLCGFQCIFRSCTATGMIFPLTSDVTN